MKNNESKNILILDSVDKHTFATNALVITRVMFNENEKKKSLDAQEERQREYCRRKGLKVLRVYRYSASSDKADRGKFKKMIKYIEAKNIPIAIVCDDVSKLRKGIANFIRLDELRFDKKVEFHFSLDNEVYDFSLNITELPHFYSRVKGVLKEIENILGRNRCSKGRKTNKINLKKTQRHSSIKMEESKWH